MRTLNTLVPTMQKLVEADYWIKRWWAEHRDATMPSATSIAAMWVSYMKKMADKNTYNHG